MKIELGDEVKCKVTKHQGIVTQISYHLNGCVQAGVQAPIDKNKKMGDNYSIDIAQLDVIKKAKLKYKEETNRGGPMIKL